MSELQMHRFPKVYQIPEDVSPAYREFYLKEDVDKLIEDLKAGHYAESVDAGMENRRLKRALYKACANWARFEGALFADEHEAEKWRKMEHKCIKKAEEYK